MKKLPSLSGALFALSAAAGLLLSACNEAGPLSKEQNSPAALSSSNQLAIHISAPLAKCQTPAPITCPQGDYNCQQQQSQQQQSAQSLMIGIQGPGDFVMQDSLLWSFRDDCAAPYFTVPPGYTDSADAVAIASAAIDEDCTFWTGGKLTPHNCNGIIATPAASVTVPQTCWTQRPVYGGKANVTYNITLASENINIAKKATTGTYSFALQNSDGSARNVNLTVTLSDAYSGLPLQVSHPNVTIVQGNKKTNNCLMDFLYNGNAGTQGVATSYLQNGTIGDILNSDGTKANNKGCSYASIAVVDPVTFNLGNGLFTITVTGTLKGIDGTADMTFGGSANVNVGPAPACPLIPAVLSAVKL